MRKICRKVSQQVAVPNRLKKILPFDRYISCFHYTADWLTIGSDAKEFQIVLNRDNGFFTGQHRISLDPSKGDSLIF